MEVEDDLGIKRGAKKRLVVPNKIYIIIKISLIAAIPVVYFICSPLLAVVILAYFGLIVITNNIEKNFNLGLKKDLHIHLPKTDSLLCLLLILITVVGIIVSSVSMTQKNSIFEGFDESQLEDVIDEGDFSSARFVWMQIWTKTKNFGTLMTGTRYFFKNNAVSAASADREANRLRGFRLRQVLICPICRNYWTTCLFPSCSNRL